jgi:catechol O-methyltransferase
MWAPFRWKRRWQGLKRRVLRLPRREQAVLDVVRRTVPKGDAQGVLDAMDQFGRAQQFLMNVGDEKAPILREAFAQSRGKLVVEVGAYCGYSAVFWGTHVRANGGRVISIEQSEDFMEIARSMVEHAGLTEVVAFENGVVESCAARLPGPIDVLFLDHAKDQYYPDLLLLEAAGLISAGTVLIADNTGIGADDVADYLAHVRYSGTYKSVEHQGFMEYSKIPDAVEVSIKR